MRRYWAHSPIPGLSSSPLPPSRLASGRPWTSPVASPWAWSRLLVSIAGLVAAVWLLRPEAPGTSTTQTVLDLALGITAIASSWLLLHTAYTLRYAHLYYCVDPDAGDAGGSDTHAGGLAFAGAPPDDLDFAYFAFAIGMAFTTSDTGVTSHRMRREVLVHAVLSFIYYTTIVALAVNLIAGRI